MPRYVPARRAQSATVRAIRAAVRVEDDTPECISASTRLMLDQIKSRNSLCKTDLISVFFTITPDLQSDLPPLAAREAGWSGVPMLCSVEAKTPSMIPKTIRALAHVHWSRALRSPRDVYLSGTTASRPCDALVTGP